MAQSVKEFHKFQLAEWLLVKEGVRVPGHRFFRQPQPVLLRVCELLELPTHGTVADLATRLKGHAFTPAQLDEVQRYHASRSIARMFQEIVADPQFQ
jgi:hypothetical protein